MVRDVRRDGTHRPKPIRHPKNYAMHRYCSLVDGCRDRRAHIPVVARLIQGVPVTGHGVALAFALDPVAFARYEDAAVTPHAGE